MTHTTLGNIDAALDYSQQCLTLLGESESYAEPYLAIARYQALVAAGRSEETQPCLERAYRILTERIDSIRDPNIRQESRENAVHVEIINTWRQAHRV